MSTLTGLTGSVQAGVPVNIIGTPAAEYQREQEWIGKGLTLVKHEGRPLFGGGRAARRLGESEASGMKIKGALRRLFLREREEGWIAAGQFEDVNEQGLFDFLITPLTLGLVHGPLPGTTTLKQNPQTGRGEAEHHASGVEEAEKAGSGLLSELTGILQRAGLTVVLALAGMLLVVYGVMVAVRPREQAFSLPGS
jgi:hypothetical protein